MVRGDLMHTFKDTLGREWAIALNVTAVRRIRDLAKVDLLDFTEGRIFARLADDPVLLADVLYATLKPDADAKGVSDEEFGRALAGDAIEAATGALLEELADFFPSRRRQVLAKGLAKVKELETLLLDRAEARIDAVDGAALAKVLDESLPAGKSSTASPASLDATPVP
jgi:hypothetical protein